MAHLFGRDWTRAQLLERFSTLDAVAGIKPIVGEDGRERGVRMLEVWTGSGLTFRILVDRALDISMCAYKGIPLAWQSPMGDVHPAYYEPLGLGWLRSFPGGLLTTCGLDQMGAPSEDGGEALGLHGRVSHLPAQRVSQRGYWVDDEYQLEISGEVRQARLFGENLVLRRRISTSLGANTIHIHDTVTNEGFAPTPHLILYHFNLGFPLLDEGVELSVDATETLARDAAAEEGLHMWHVVTPPIDGYAEQVFRHRLQSGNRVGATLVNHSLGLRLRLTADPATLPYLWQWKKLERGTYVMGLEPANSGVVAGRGAAREQGDLVILAPSESRSYNLEVAVTQT